MRYLMMAALMVAAAAYAQAPVVTGRPSEARLQHDQMKAGNAYRDMQNAERAARDAEQDYRQAESIHKDTQKRADEARRHAEVLASKPIASLVECKRAITAGLREPFAAARAREDAAFQRLLGTAANLEALTAFAERRTPDFAAIDREHPVDLGRHLG